MSLRVLIFTGLIFAFNINAQLNIKSNSQVLIQKQSLTDQNYKNVVKVYEQITNFLNTQNSSMESCGGSKPKEGETCSFASVCKVMRKFGNQEYLYKNAQNEKIPNYELNAFLKSAQLCLKRSIIDKYADKLEEDALRKKSETPTYAEARLDLLQEVKKKNFNKKFSKFEEAVLNFDIDVETKDMSVFRRVMLAEEKSKIDLPESISNKYITMAKKLDRMKYQESYGDTSKLINDKKELELYNSVRLIKNPFQDISMMGANPDNNKKYSDQFKKQEIRSVDIFKESKKSVLEFIKNKLSKNMSKKTDYDSMVKRIETVKFRIDRSVPYKNYQTACSTPNAFYSADKHTVTLCPQLLELPSAALKYVISHELGHAIDPCIMASPLRKVRDMRGNEVHMVSLFDQDGGGIIAKSIPFTEFPEKKVISCLMSDDSLEARASDIETARKGLRDRFIRGQSLGIHDDISKMGWEQIDRIYDQYKGCSNLPGRTQVGEGWSDWVGTEILAHDLKKIPEEKKHQYSFEAFGLHIGRSCGIDNKEVITKVKKTLEALNCSGESNLYTATSNENRKLAVNDVSVVRSLMNIQHNEHSLTADRFNKLLLAHPEIRKSLGCSPKDGGKYCE